MAYGERGDFVGEQGRVGGGVVGKDFRAVGTDEVKSVVGGAHPFAVGGIDGYGRNRHAVEEVVGVVRAVVARHLYLCDKEVAIEPCRGVVDYKHAVFSADPNLPVQVLRPSVGRFERHVCAVLVGGGSAVESHVVAVVERAFPVHAEHARSVRFGAAAGEHPQAASVVETDAVGGRNHFERFYIHAVPAAVGAEHLQGGVALVVGNPEVALRVELRAESVDIEHGVRRLVGTSAECADEAAVLVVVVLDALQVAELKEPLSAYRPVAGSIIGVLIKLAHVAIG